VFCIEHTTLSLARAWTWTIKSTDKHTNHEATARQNKQQIESKLNLHVTTVQACVWCLFLRGKLNIITGHLTGCSGVDPHNLLTSTSSTCHWNFFPHKTDGKKCSILAIKQLPYNPTSKNSEKIDYLKVVFLPKQQQKQAIYLGTNF